MFKVNPDGSIETDSAEEALKLQRIMLGQASGQFVDATEPSRPAPSPRPVAEVEAWQAFAKVMSGRHPKLGLPRSLLNLIRLKSPHAMDKSSLAEAMGVDLQTIGGHISGLRKRARTAGLDPDLLLKVDEKSGHVSAGRLLISMAIPEPDEGTSL